MHKKYVNLDEVLYIQNFKESLKKWFDNHTKQIINPHSQQSDPHRSQQDFTFYFDLYTQTIKPVINKFFEITYKLNPQKYAFYSTLIKKKQVKRLQNIYQSLNKFEILSSQDQINQNQICRDLNQIRQICEKRSEIYKMNLNIVPQNDELKYWSHTVEIKNFKIEGIITKGKGIGNEALGMPTANVSIPFQVNQSLKAYPYGIYVSTVTIKGQNRTFLGASSLGTNPHYQNNKSNRILQIYIINDFGDQILYEKTLIVQFFHLIRLQLDFKGFSPFLNGMRNDIEVTKNFKYLLLTDKQ